MLHIKLPYYKDYLDLNLPERCVKAVLVPQETDGSNLLTEKEIVENALFLPIDSPRLADLAVDKKNVVIITSDHTRPVPSKITMPVLLEEIRSKNPDVAITILVATGMHRQTTKEELEARFGKEITAKEKIVVHDAYDDQNMAYLGILPSGGELWINKLAVECDLLVAEGFIEPHFFAGFSGGRKSVLPGIASKKTVLWNHNANFIASPRARTGILRGNPIQRDMVYAAKCANLQFILNVALDADKKIIQAFAGDYVKAHEMGCAFVKARAKVKKATADIVITTNGGYPLDQNLYQAVKGMTAAEACVNPGGVIIICSSCVDGSGGDFFYHLLADEPNAQEAFKKLNGVPPAETQFDQWESQILARILCKATVILVSTHIDPEIPKAMHLQYAKSVDAALAMARKIVGADKKIVVIPDGVGVIV